MKNVDISIIIPCYNSYDVLRSLDSIFDIDHYGINAEVVLCIDKNDNITEKIVLESKYGEMVIIVRPIIPGVTANRNAGIKEAKGKYTYFLDSDDTIDPFFFEHIKPLLDDDYDMVYGGGYNFSSPFLESNYKTIIPYHLYDSFFSNEKHIPYSYCTYLFKTSFLRNEKLYVDESITNSEDYLFVTMCLSKMPKLGLSPFYFFKYWKTASSLSNRNTLKDCISSVNSFDTMLKLLDSKGYLLSKKRYASTFVQNTIEKGACLNKKDKKTYLKILKDAKYKTIVKESHPSFKKYSYLWLGCSLTWKLIKIKRGSF